MDRQSIVAFHDEFEKISALYDPRVHNTPEKLERLRRMEELLLKNRIKNTPEVAVKSWGIKDAPAMLGANPEYANPMIGGGYWMDPSGGTPTVYKPKGVAEHATIFGAGNPNSGAVRMAKNTAVHHELDEAASYAAREAGKRTGEEMRWAPTVGEVYEGKVPKKMRRSAKNLYRKGVEKLPEGAQKYLGTLSQASSAPHAPSAMHLDPDVMLSESNRVARLDPEARKRMMWARNLTKEKELLKRQGVRYGEEYIAPKSKRWDKARGSIQREISSQNDALTDLGRQSEEFVDKSVKPRIESVQERASKFKRDVALPAQSKVREIKRRITGQAPLPAQPYGPVSPPRSAVNIASSTPTPAQRPLQGLFKNDYARINSVRRGGPIPPPTAPTYVSGRVLPMRGASSKLTAAPRSLLRRGLGALRKVI